MTWKQHVADSMRGKKFSSRTEANEFMKKLSAEWKSKKGGTLDEFAASQPSTTSGSGRRRRPKVMKVQSDDEGDGLKDLVSRKIKKEVKAVKAGYEAYKESKHGQGLLYGGSTSLLLMKGLGDGVHFSVLPK